MLKRIIALTMALFSPMLLLSSCFSGEPSPAPESSSNALESTVETAPEKVILSSFYAIGSFGWDYIKLMPEKDSPESEQYTVLYADKFVNGELCPYPDEGETFKIVYDSKINAHPTENGGIINRLYSMTLKNDPRIYGGINYGVAVMRQGYSMDGVSEADINAGKENMGMDMLIAKSSSELKEYAYSYFFNADPQLSGNYTEDQVIRTKRWTDRYALLADYNDEFFKANDLIMLFIYSGSGSCRYDVNDIVIDGSSMTIHTVLTHNAGTDDVAQWILFVSVPKSVSEGITEYKSTFTVPEGMFY